jgi:hypothetical protein
MSIRYTDTAEATPPSGFAASCRASFRGASGARASGRGQRTSTGPLKASG